MKFLINKFIFRYKDVLICSDEGDNIFVLFHILTSEKVDPAYAPSDAPYTEDFLDRLKDNLNPNCYNILITKNGFHVLVRPQLVDAKFQKTWFSYLNLMPECDVTGDSLIPIPGCSQGNFNPYLLMA